MPDPVPRIGVSAIPPWPARPRPAASSRCDAPAPRAVCYGDTAGVRDGVGTGDDKAAMRDGDILQGRFRLDRQIGRGGFARVFLCTDLTLERRVAIKILDHALLERADEHDFLARFRREARAVAALDHPNILGIHDYGEDDGTIYLVMPFIEGGTLHERLTGGRALDPATAGNYLRQVAAALDYAHRRGIVHRDIKPQNMLLRAEDDRLLLADFGIAKVLGDTGAQTRTGAAGTIAYMAPEQFRGEISPALDIYALGCVLFQMLTGRLPFVGSTEQMIFGHLSGPVPSLAELGGGRLPATLPAVVEGALGKDPAARYPTASDLARAFDRALEGDDTRGRAVPRDVGDNPTALGPSPTQAAPPSSRTTGGPPPGEPTIIGPLASVTGPTPLPPLPTHGTPPPDGIPAAQQDRPAGGAIAASGVVPPIPFPPAATPARRGPRLPLLAGAGALLLLLLLGGLALQQRGAGVRPRATLGGTLVAVAGTVTATAPADTPTATTSTGSVTVAPTPPATTATSAGNAATTPTTAPTPAPSPSARATSTPTLTAPPTRAPLRGGSTTTFIGHNDHVRGVAWNDAGRTLISGAGDGTVRFWRADGTLVNTIGGRTFAVTSVAPSPDGALLAIGADGPSNQVQIWRADGTPVATLAGHTDNVGMVAWSPDGQTLATASSDRTVRLWTAAGRPLRTLTGHDDIVQNVAWSPDGQRLVSASWDKTVRVWRADGTLLAALIGHSDAVFGVAWSPDGNLIASASQDKTVRLWVPDGTPRKTLAGHTAAVSSVAWSPDGRTLASGSFDKTIHLWAADGSPLATLVGHGEAVTSLAWLPGGDGLASGSWDKTIRLWR